MKSFLDHIANYLKSKHEKDFDRIWLVFPNRRSGMFFRKYFAEQFDVPVWSPRVFTMSELMLQLSNLQIPDRLQLIFDLYEVYVEITKREEPFDEFYFLGNMILNDFDHVDKQLVNPKDLFANLADLKQIDFIFDYLSDEQKLHIEQFWGSIKSQGKYKFQDEFIQIWNLLFPLYTSFHTRLKEQGLAYEGMLYRSIAEKYEGLSNVVFPFSTIYFIGLNALSKSETTLLMSLKKRKLSNFFWDYDHYYLDKNYHEAGYFMRENLKNFPMADEFLQFQNKSENTGQSALMNKISLFRNINNDKKNIFFYPVNSQVMQVKAASSILESLNPDNEESPDLNALILPDEKLLLPMLFSLPEKFTHVNITMGYPVSNSLGYSFIETLIDLQKNKRFNGEKVRFYHKQILGILDHPFFTFFETEETRTLRNDITSNNLIYVDNILLGDDEVSRKIFSLVDDTPLEFIGYLKFCLYAVSLNFNNQSSDKITNSMIEQEANHQLYLSLTRLETILSEREIEIGLNTFIRFFKQAVRQINLPFSGEPLRGLQIMGVLETRVLDFKNIIITSMNEAVFPKSQSQVSFIPYNLRKAFDLPVSNHQDSISAYYFYRLLQRAENVHLIYTTQNSDFGKSEMSRYLYQLMFDSDFDVTIRQTGLDLQLDRSGKIVVEKDEKVWEKLSRFLSTEENTAFISPSALNDYLICNLRFFFKYVTRIKVPKEINEDVDALIFGNILHQAIEKLYKPYVGKIISAKEFGTILKDEKNQKNILIEAFNKEFLKRKTPAKNIPVSGKNSLALEVLAKYLKQIILIDKQQSPMEIVDLEMSVQHNYRLENIDANINLGGTIDRVDRPGKFVRIVDYKTGADKKNLKDPNILYEKGNRKDFKAIFQLYVYAWLYKECKNVKEDIDLALYITKEMFGKNYSAAIVQKNNPLTYFSLKEHFEEELKSLLEEIFDKETPFTQVEDSEVCLNCDYKDVCRRV